MAKKLRFQGFAKPNYTMVPDEVFDDLLSHLSGSELKVLLYIIRRTFGFKKSSDDISFSQICSGIITKEGKVLDTGTGLSSSTAQKAVKGLEEKQIILATRNYSDEKGNEPTTYSLNIISAPYIENHHRGVPFFDHPHDENRHRGLAETDKALYRESPTQKTVVQQTDSDSSDIDVDNSLTRLTDRLKVALAGQLTRATYEAHVAHLEIEEIFDFMVVIRVPSELSKEWLEGRLAKTFETTLTALLGDPMKVLFRVN